MKKRLRIVIPILLLLIAGGMVYRRLQNQPEPGGIRVAGNIEVTAARLGFKIPGRLQERRVEEGDAVQKGDYLAMLDPADQELGVAQAEANLAYARAFLAELKAGSRPEEIKRAEARADQARFALEDLRQGSRYQEIATAQAELDRAGAAVKAASAQLQQAREDFERFSALFKQDQISRREYEMQRTRHDTALNAEREAKARMKSARQGLSLRQEGARVEEIHKAEAALQQAQADLALVKAGPRQETIQQAEARALLAEKALDLSRQQLANTRLLAPMDGIVLSKAAEPGEYLNPGTPVLTLGDLGRPWVRAYVTETDLGRIRLHAPAKVRVDAYPQKEFAGRVSYIAGEAEFTPKSVQTFEERVKLMFRIKILVENPAGELKPGMPADARIEIKAGAK